MSDLTAGAADPRAPFVRLAVVGLLGRGPVGASDATGPAGSGRWLLLHRSDPMDFWDPPGGRMERDEDLTSAVIREVAEETGLDVRVAGPCYAYLTMYKGERLLAVTMACRPEGDPEAVRLEPGGASEWSWATTEEWADLAAAGRSSWSPGDVTRVTRMARTLWEVEDGE